MTLEQYANLAEIIGVTIVILTLIFLALQIRQNTKALRSTTLQAILQTELDLVSVLVENAGTFEKILTSAPLAAGEETRKAIMLFNATMLEAENRYHQSRIGYLSPREWEERLTTVRMMVSLPIFELWRHSVGALTRSAAFRELVDRLAQESSAERAS